MFEGVWGGTKLVGDDSSGDGSGGLSEYGGLESVNGCLNLC